MRSERSETLIEPEVRVYITLPDDPEEGRTFVWARTRWYERFEEESGNVAFSPVASSEEELRLWLGEEESDLLVEVDDDYAELVREEFLEHTPLYPEAPELSDEPPFQEQRVDGSDRF